jgi:kinesin family protein 5
VPWCAETFSSLRFGQRAKKIQNNAVINVQYSAEELQKQLAVAKKEIQKLAQRLGIAEKELQIWRSGGSVSEEDRVTLSADEVKEKAQAEAEPAIVHESGLSEEEREELLRRETELLDLLDDKDEHIRQLEREIEVLGQDKITITKLAAESANQRAKIMELEARIEEVCVCVCVCVCMHMCV